MGAREMGVLRDENGDRQATTGLMRVKEDLFLSKTGGNSDGREKVDNSVEAIAYHVYEKVEKEGEGTEEDQNLTSSVQRRLTVRGAVDWGLQACAHPDGIKATGAELKKLAGVQMMREVAVSKRIGGPPSHGELH